MPLVDKRATVPCESGPIGAIAAQTCGFFQEFRGGLECIQIAPGLEEFKKGRIGVGQKAAAGREDVEDTVAQTVAGVDALDVQVGGGAGEDIATT